MQETWVQFLGQEDPLEKGMATHSSIFAWRIPWTEVLGTLQSMGSKRVRHDYVTKHAFMHVFTLNNTRLPQCILPIKGNTIAASAASSYYSVTYCCCCLVTSVVSDSVQPYGLQPASLLCPWESPGKNTRVGCHALFRQIFPTQGSNLGLLHCRQILYL